jgi:hypothetical protein
MCSLYPTLRILSDNLTCSHGKLAMKVDDLPIISLAMFQNYVRLPSGKLI